jgi:hypothetical protein
MVPVREDGRGVYHPERACAWCAHERREDLRLVPFKRTETLALVCVDVNACIRRQYELKVTGRIRDLAFDGCAA